MYIVDLLTITMILEVVHIFNIISLKWTPQEYAVPSIKDGNTCQLQCILIKENKLQSNLYTMKQPQAFKHQYVVIPNVKV